MQDYQQKNKKLEEDLLIKNGEIAIVRNKLYKTNDKNLELENMVSQAALSQKQIERDDLQSKNTELERYKTELKFKV